MNSVSSVVKSFFQVQRLAFLLLIVVSCGVAADGVTLPQNCIESCVTPYGELLGMSADGVQAYSNCQGKCVVFDPNKLNGTYTGIKWQCVEYARRWLIQNRGLTFGDVDVAADIWRLTELKRVNDQSDVALTKFENGAIQPLKAGDLLIYGREYLGTGHTAIVLQVDRKHGIVRVAEQNFKNKRWSGQYARTIQFVRKEGRYWLLDAYILGWMRTQY